MIGADAFTSDFVAAEIATAAFWGLNAIFAMVVLHGLIVHRSLVAAYYFAAIWALTACLYFAAPMLGNVQLSLVDSFFLLCAIVPVAQAILELIGAIDGVLGPAKSPDGE